MEYKLSSDKAYADCVYCGKTFIVSVYGYANFCNYDKSTLRVRVA